MKHWNVTVFSGQPFNVSLLAAAQVGTTTTLATAVTSSTARLEAFQTTQFVRNGCHMLQYTVYSSKSYEEIKLYADGPCRDVGDTNVVILHAYIRPCPDGFVRVQDICTCEEAIRSIMSFVLLKTFLCSIKVKFKFLDEFVIHK